MCHEGDRWGAEPLSSIKGCNFVDELRVLLASREVLCSVELVLRQSVSQSVSYIEQYVIAVITTTYETKPDKSCDVIDPFISLI